MGRSRVVATGAALLAAASGAPGGDAGRPLRWCPPPERAAEQSPARAPVEILPLPLSAPDRAWPADGPTIIPPLREDFPREGLERALSEQRWLQELLRSARLEAEARPEGPFMPVEHDGLIAQLTSISSQVWLNQQQFGRPGGRESRSLQMSGALYDLSGARAFRIVGAPRLVELTDERGRDLRATWEWSAYPDANNPQGFTRPTDSPGSMTQQSFSISGSGDGELPRRIGVLRIEMEVAVASEFGGGMIRAEASGAFECVADGVEARVTMVREQDGCTSLGVEYRLARSEDKGRPWFVRAEILDDEQRLLSTVESSNEVETRGSVVGSVVAWNVDTRRAPAYYVRLQFVPAESTTRLEIVERDLPLMGG